ncbi:MAG TPA: tetratricopeptide repeat protein [Caldilineae bacterium]|nr:tetratricopeptide repeat protein [Caldilineae bacterium]
MPRRKRRAPVASTNAFAWPVPEELAPLLAMTVIPALFNIQSGASFEPDKAAMLISLAAAALAARLWRAWRQPQRRAITLPAVLLAGLALWAILVTLAAIDPVTSLWGNYERGYGLLIVLAGLAFLAIAWEMTRAGKGWWLVDAAILGAAIPVFYGYVQMLGLDPVRGVGISFPLGERAASTLGNPLYLGDYLLLTSILLLARRILRPPDRPAARHALDLALLLAAGLLGLTFSRSAYLGLAASGLTLTLFWWGQRRRMGAAGRMDRWVAGGVLLAVGMGAAAMIALWPRLQHGGTLQQRLLIWRAVIDLMQARPRALLTGLGFDTLPLALAPHLSPTLAHFEPDFAFRIADRAHSLPLELVSTGGLPWLLGWAALAGWLLWRLGRSAHPLAPYLAAAIVGRAALLLVSFPTHAPDLLFWVILGLGLGITSKESSPFPEPPSRLHPETWLLLTLAPFMVFGFSLSASWPGGLLLWLLALAPLIALTLALSPSRPLAPSPLPLLALAFLLLPAILLNQRIGPPAMVAWAWLHAWLLLLVFLPAFMRDSRPAISRVALLAAITLAMAFALTATVQRPRLGDIAYKAAWLSPDANQRELNLRRALRLAPYDHVMAAGMAWIEAQRVAAEDAWGDEARLRRISKLYQEAMAAQPLAPEPAMGYARWLASLPNAHAQALAAFDRALTLSPHDIQALNDRAMRLAALGRTDEALAELQRLLQLDPLYGPTYGHLAQVYRQLGDEEAARAILEQGRAAAPWWDSGE